MSKLPLALIFAPNIMLAVWSVGYLISVVVR